MDKESAEINEMKDFSFPKEDEIPESLEDYSEASLDKEGIDKMGVFHPDLQNRFGGKSYEELKFREESSSTSKELFLETQETSSSKNLGGGINQTDFVEIQDDGSVVFKPVTGESETVREYAKPGSYYKRERAAYLVSRVIGFDLVPTTVIREVDGKVGSAQEFIPDATLGSYMDFEESMQAQKDLGKLWAFDYLIYNSDRHGKNFLYKEGMIHAIDNGLSFAPDNLKIWSSRKSFSVEESSFITEFNEDKQRKELLIDLLKELLSNEEVEAFFSRLTKLCSVIEAGEDRIPNLKEYK